MPCVRTSARALTLVEMLLATAIAAVLSIVGWATWEMGRSDTSTAMSRGEQSRHSFSVLQIIEQEVMRASTIEVPDPDHADVDSIQLHVPTATDVVRRAFRLENGDLVIEMKDEGARPFVAFPGLVDLSFTVLDPPVNSLVRISCTSGDGEQAVIMQTVAKRRN